MTITLSDLRQHCSDLAHEAADTKAARVRMTWIRGALSRLHMAHDWKWFYATQRIALDPEETGTDLDVTQDANTFVRDSTWTSKYASQLWDCMAANDTTQAFQFASIATVTATLATGQYWQQSTDTNTSYTMSRWRYSMPDNFVGRIMAVEDIHGYRKLRHLIVSDFDRQRNRFPHRRGQPEYFTVRDPRYLEVHPGNDSTRRALQVTYLRTVTLPADADVDGTTVDWPSEYVEVMYKALALEAAIWLGQASKIPYPVAKQEYDESLKRATSRDSRMVEISSEFGLETSYPDPVTTRFVYNTGSLD